MVVFSFPDYCGMRIRPHHEEANLLSLIASGDPSALIELFDWYYDQLGYSIFSITGSLEVAEQAAQDTFVMIWFQKEALVNISECWGYLFVIARNMASAAIREKTSRKARLSSSASEHPLTSQRALIKETMDRLPGQQKQVCILIQQRMSLKEISIQLRIPIDKVQEDAHNGLKSLRIQLSVSMPTCVALILTSVLLIGD